MLKRISDYVVVDTDNNRLTIKSIKEIYFDVYKCRELAMIQYNIMLPGDSYLSECEFDFKVDSMKKVMLDGNVVTLAKRDEFVRVCKGLIEALSRKHFPDITMSTIDKYIRTLKYISSIAIDCNVY